MKKTTKLIVAIGFVAFLFAPIASFFFGVRASAIENRRLAPRPQLALSRIVEPEFYEEVQSYVVDRLPLRNTAIQLSASLDYYVFNESANTQEVFRGEDRWLYLRETFDDACAPNTGDAPTVAAEIERLAAVVVASGRTFVFTIAPDKLSIYPEHLGSMLTERATCASDKRDGLRAIINADPMPELLDMWTFFEQERSQTDDPLYYRDDSHWNTLGAAQWLEMVVERVQPGTWDPSALVLVGPEDHRGNLVRQMGLTFDERVDLYTVERNGVAVVDEEELGVSFGSEGTSTLVVTTSASPGTDVVEPKTVILKDSFMDIPQEMFIPYFANVVFSDWRDSFSVEFFVESAVDAGAVVVESSEHGLWARFVDARLSNQLVAALIEDLPNRNLELAAASGTGLAATSSGGIEGASKDATLDITLDSGSGATYRYLVVEYEPGTARARPTLRLDDGERMTGQEVGLDVRTMVYELPRDARSASLVVGTSKILSARIVNVP